MSINAFLRFLVKHYPFVKGRSRITRFAKRYVKGITLYTDSYGNRFLLDLDNFIDNEIYLRGIFEEKSIHALTELIMEKRCKYFVDIGANMGIYTVLFAKRFSFERIYAFEPDPRNFSQLHANIFLNNLYDKVAIYNLALSSEDSEKTFYLSRNKKDIDNEKLNTGTSSLLFNKDRHISHAVITVQTIKLDDLLQIKNQSIVIKIDVEGHEYNVLKGMQNLLSNNNCVLSLELFQNNFSSVNGYLNDNGYMMLMPEFEKSSEYNYIYLKS